MAENGTDPKADRQFVTSLERGLRLISAFRPDDRMLSNQELADRTGLPRPTVVRFTHTLRRLKYLALHADEGRYSLTPRVLELSRSAFIASAIQDVARPIMTTLSEIGPISVALGVPVDQGIRYIELARRPEAIVLNLNVGAVIPILTTAIGRAYLASMNPSERNEALAMLERKEPSTFSAHIKEIETEFGRYPAQCYASSFGSWWPELSAIGTHIRVVEDGDPLLLSVSGLSSIVTRESVAEEYASALLNAAQAIRSQIRRTLAP
ncbi:helix-turn-helix domain-containing protein [Sedimentitalea sp.]|uniref:IclR family transcriptional regulator n=1 Tax=Sedimentitalea sp. TaxID=2048915 RepID=UPI0032967C3C